MLGKIRAVADILETADPDAEENDADGKATESPVGVRDHRRECRDNQQDMAEHRHGNGSMDGLEASPFGVGDIPTKERDEVGPEAIESD